MKKSKWREQLEKWINNQLIKNVGTRKLLPFKSTTKDDTFILKVQSNGFTQKKIKLLKNLTLKPDIEKEIYG